VSTVLRTLKSSDCMCIVEMRELFVAQDQTKIMRVEIHNFTLLSRCHPIAISHPPSCGGRGPDLCTALQREKKGGGGTCYRTTIPGAMYLFLANLSLKEINCFLVPDELGDGDLLLPVPVALRLSSHPRVQLMV
jgi:hypothetical protein